MHNPGQRSGLRSGSSTAENEGSERVVVPQAGLLQPSSITGEGDFRGGQSKQRPTQREGTSIIE